MDQESVVALPILRFDAAEDKFGRRRRPPEPLCSPALHTQKVTICYSGARDQFKRNRKYPQIESSLVTERLASKPAAEEATTDCARHFGAWRLGAAGEKPISNVRQSRDPPKAVKIGIPRRSCVGHRLKAIASWPTVGTQSRDVELSRNWQAKDGPSAFARGDVLRDAFGARRVVGVHGAVFRCRTSAAARGYMPDIAA